MRRAVTEWGLVISGLLSLVLGLAWVDSLWLRTFQEPLWLGPDCFLRVDAGRLCFFSELGEHWKPDPGGLGQPFASFVRQYSNWMLPGLEYHNRQLASGESVWSFEVAIVVPLAVLLAIILTLWRIRRGRWGIGHSDSIIEMQQGKPID